MTTKLLIVGNSHVAAMSQGWEMIASDFPDIEVSFYGANSTLFRLLAFQDGLNFGIHDRKDYKVRHATFIENMFGSLTVNMAEFDRVLVVGQNTNEVDYLRQFEGYSIDGRQPREGKPRLSESAFEAFCEGIAMKRMPAPGWQNWTDTKLHWLPVPIPREDCPLDSERYGVWARYAEEGFGLPYLGAFRSKVREIYAKAGIEVLDPPAEIYAANGLTKAKFGKAPGKLQGTVTDYTDDDFHHMNGEYGAVILRDMLKNF